MSVFDEYARYYNLLYADKDYDAEVGYVDQLLKKHATKPVEHIVDIGSGTGNHDLLLARKGYRVDGVDRAVNMVDIARARVKPGLAVTFHQGDAASFDLGIKADAVVSLFHVMSYLTATDELAAAFANARRHVSSGGLFAFDFWYGPAVLTERPTERLKTMQDDATDVYRFASPVLRENDNVVEVRYKVVVVDRATQQARTIDELHEMRYFFLPELSYLLDRAGFDICAALRWMSLTESPGCHSWNACMVGRARG